VDPTTASQLIETATSWRDKAILTLLYRTGQRIGDWSAFAGRHGILGMTLADIDEHAGMITVLLKGARDEHRSLPGLLDPGPLGLP
jgi:site-specific recombinase XerD